MTLRADATACVADILAERAAGDGDAAKIEQALHLGHQRAQAAGVKKILHQIFAGRRDVGDHRHLARNGVEAGHVQRHAGAARHGNDVDDGVGRAAERHVDADGVVERRRVEDLLRRQIFPHHLDDAAAGIAAHAWMIGVDRGDRGGAGQAKSRSPRRSPSWWRRCPSPCRCRTTGRCRLRSRSIRSRRSCRRVFRPSISIRPSPSRASRRANCRAASARPAHRLPAAPWRSRP